MTDFKNISSKTMLQYNDDPLQNFLYALKAPDSKRQYPRRFEYFLDYLEQIRGIFEGEMFCIL